MTLSILLFASLAEAAGTASIELSVPMPTTAGALRAVVLERLGDLRQPPSIRVAVNQRFVDDGHAVTAGDEIALIPPVAGG